MKFAPLLIAGLALLLAGCTPPVRPTTDYSLQREAIAGTHAPPPAPLQTGNEANQPIGTAAATAESRYGTGVFINGVAAANARAKGAAAAAGNGDIVFNFDNQPVQAAVKAILGDVLHENYSIAPDVKGTITFATAQPVTREEVLPILEMLLSWTGNALVYQNGGYVVMPADKAAPGNLVPGLGAVPPETGYAARLFPLHYVSADAMQKLLKPFAQPGAFLLVDPQRNLLVMAGTPDELANYQRTIRIFDVDWLRGMSVAVIPLQHVEADDLTGQLQKMFSEQGAKGQELSGMVRLIPLKQSNSLVVITPQPAYLDEVRQLVTTIDTGAGDSSGLYVYDVHNVKASDLATDLNELFGNPSNAVQAPPGAVAPGFSPLEQSSPGSLGGPSEGFGNFTPETGNYPNGAGSGAEGGVGAGMVSGATQARRQQQQQQQGPTVFTTSEGVRIAAVNSNNQLLVRAKPGQWEKLLPVIQRLDQQPLQVQIETRVLEVTLTGQFQFGVQHYLGGLIGTQPGSPPNTNESYHRHQGAVGLGGVQYNPATDALFYSFAGNKLQVALKAMEQSGDVRVLSAPSSVVLNNQEATFKVGEKIPVVQTYFAPGYGVASGTSTGYNVGQVQYIDTGVLLDVVPRVNPGGLVYMDIQQVVSQPVSKDQYGNYTLSNRALSTQVAVQSGQTVLLGGLIQQQDNNTDTGVPFLNRVPVLGRLFGTTDRTRTRTELSVLITPRVISNPLDARAVTDEYETRFESLKPILPGDATADPGHGGVAGADGAGADAASRGVPATAAGAQVSPTVSAPAPVIATRNPASHGGWAVQVASLMQDDTARHLRERLQQLGYPSYVDSASTPAGVRWRVYAGPVVNRDAAERLRAGIAESLHISGMMIVQR